MQKAVEAKVRKIRVAKVKGEKTKEEQEEKKKKKKQKKEKMMEIKKVVKEWEIWDDKEKVARLEEKLKKLVLEQFYKLIKVFEKIVSEKMLMRKMWDHMIDLEEGFVPRKVIPCLQKRESTSTGMLG